MVFSFMDWRVEEDLYSISMNLHGSVILSWTWQGVKAMWLEYGQVYNGCWVKPYKQCGSFAASECFQWEKETCFGARRKSTAESRVALCWCLHFFFCTVFWRQSFPKLTTLSNYFYNIRVKILNHEMVFQANVKNTTVTSFDFNACFLVKTFLEPFIVV